MPKGIGRKGQGVPKTVLETLDSREDLAIFVELLERSDLRDFLERGAQTDMHEFVDEETELTIFAPKDSAFEKLEDVTWDELVNPANRAALTKLLKRHIVPQPFPSHRFRDRNIETLGGWMAPMEVEGKKVWFAGGPVTRTDVKCEDGWLHHVTGVALDGEGFGGP